MNTLDFIIIAIAVICAIVGYQRGLVRTVFRLVSFAIALILAINLQPVVAGFLRGTFMYEGIQNRIASAAGFDRVFAEHTPNPGIAESARGSNIINALPLPESVRDTLYTSNTPDMFELLRVRTIEEYVTGFFANIVINVFSLLIVFIIVFLILHFVGKILNIVDYIPVVGTLNQVGGLIAGVLIGGVFIWVGLYLMTMLFSTSANEVFYNLIQGSALVGWLINNGWLLNRVTAV
ncbi:MAG: CvpA family protein [Defluviitaleaceae bacterium]|nr:CvpA family protein [Defluviitaleaceae bacterium]